jgi:type II restriction enzyme
MKLGFEELQAPYVSGSQSARVWTERWVRAWAYCPNCDSPKIIPFPNNSPVADFFCEACKDEYELKSQKTIFTNKVLDGSYRTKCERLAASNNPNLFLLNYDLKELRVTNLLVIPKHFFVREIIEQRKPLSANAKRAGWIGSNILLNQIPESGKIYIVRGSRLGRRYPSNRNVKPKIRQQLQYLRDRGYLDFVSRGFYRLRSEK